MTQNAKDYNRPADMSSEALAVLKTVQLLEKDFGAGYLVRILQGDMTFPLRNHTHKSLETFGELDAMPFNQIENLIYFLVKENLLEISNEVYGNVAITKAGKAFLDQPSPLMISPSEIRNSWHQIDLAQSLRQLRKEMALRAGCAPYQIFNNYTLRCLIDQPPHTDEDLLEFNGMGSISFEERATILDEINRIMALKAIDDKTGIYRKSRSSRAREVKHMYEEGLSIAEIAKEREVKTVTIQGYLEALHRTGEIDLKPWIEENVDPRILHKATEYFKKARTPRLKEAHEVLGYTYDQLRLCQIYATTQVEDIALKYAS